MNHVSRYKNHTIVGWKENKKNKKIRIIYSLINYIINFPRQVIALNLGCFHLVKKKAEVNIQWVTRI